MSAVKVTRDINKFGHQSLSQEDATMMVLGLRDQISITLQGVDIVRGTHDNLGPITLVMPAVGESSLLFPFEKESDFVI